MRTTTKNTLATKTVSQGESRYGTPEPQIALRFPKGTGAHRRRRLRALLLRGASCEVPVA